MKDLTQKGHVLQEFVSLFRVKITSNKGDILKCVVRISNFILCCSVSLALILLKKLKSRLRLDKK
jgi:hypothetical protein